MKTKIVIGVTGGIAAYKAVSLASKLKQNGYEIRVMMTKSATKFISPLSFQAFSSDKVMVDMFDDDSYGVSHVHWADWADLIIIAPATANIIAKIKAGIADDYLTTTVMASQAPVIIAPAMNVHMYNNPIVGDNLRSLAKLGYRIVESEEGYLACGYTGKGRLASEDVLIAEIEDLLNQEQLIKGRAHNSKLNGKKIMITAGPTREAIDPVRYISNYSSGKMGYSLAEAADHLGAQVTLISGPTTLGQPTGVKVIDVVTASQMYEASMAELANQDIIIMTAAVADYRPASIADQKIKKTAGDFNLQLEKTEDILLAVSQQKKSNQIVVGFAAESENVLANAQDKLKRKDLDMIVANDISGPDSGFHVDDNEVDIIYRDGRNVHIAKTSKKEVAYKVLASIEELI